MNGQINVQEEAGSTDNRLSLSPGEFPQIKDWEDGSKYTVTLTVVQQSPGEFDVVSVDTAGEAEAEEAAPEAQAEPAGEGEGEGGYPNPAVRRMMRGGRQQSMM